MTNHPKILGGGFPAGATGSPTPPPDMTPQTLTLLPPPAAAANNASSYPDLFQNLYDGVMITDFAGSILDINTRMLGFLLAEKQDICGHPISECISGVDDALLQTALRNLADQRFTQIEAYCLRKDETYFPSDVVVSGLQHTGQEWLFFFIRDITHRKAMEEQLLHDKEAVEEQLLRIKEAVQKHTQFLETLFTSMPNPTFHDSFSVWNKQFVHHLKNGPVRNLQ